jgi:hypothetical protein
MAEEGRFISPFEGPRLAILVTFDAILSSKETLRIRGVALVRLLTAPRSAFSGTCVRDLG